MFRRRQPGDPTLDEEVESVLRAISVNAAKIRQEAEMAAINNDRMKKLARETERLVNRLRESGNV